MQKKLCARWRRKQQWRCNEAHLCARTQMLKSGSGIKSVGCMMCDKGFSAAFPDILFLKHDSGIFRHIQNVACGSWTSQARAKPVPSWRNHIPRWDMKCWRGCMYCLSQQRTRYRDRRQDVVQEMVQENLQTDHSKSCYRVGWLFKNMLLSYFRKRMSASAAYHESIQWVIQRFYLWGSCIRGDVVRIRQRKTFIHWGGINLRSESVLDKIKLKSLTPFIVVDIPWFTSFYVNANVPKAIIPTYNCALSRYAVSLAPT